MRTCLHTYVHTHIHTYYNWPNLVAGENELPSGGHREHISIGLPTGLKELCRSHCMFITTVYFIRARLSTDTKLVVSGTTDSICAAYSLPPQSVCHSWLRRLANSCLSEPSFGKLHAYFPCQSINRYPQLKYGRKL
jgi:hypothetical protein